MAEIHARGTELEESCRVGIWTQSGTRCAALDGRLLVTLNTRTARGPDILACVGQCSGLAWALLVALGPCPCSTGHSRLSPAGGHSVWLPQGLWQNQISLPQTELESHLPLSPISYYLGPGAPHRELLRLPMVTACCPNRMIPLWGGVHGEHLPRQRPLSAAPKH